MMGFILWKFIIVFGTFSKLKLNYDGKSNYDIQVALSLVPSSAEAHFLLAQLHEANKDAIAARGEYERAVCCYILLAMILNITFGFEREYTGLNRTLRSDLGNCIIHKMN